MTFSINFLERREGDSPSIERVFRSVAANIDEASTTFTKASYGNSFLGTIGNMLLFRPAKADIVHITGHISFMALALPRDKTVLTIHDLTILDLRSGVRRSLINWLYFILPARRTRFVTAISEATKEKLVQVTGVAADRITVIENPLLVRESAVRPFNIDRPTILQIGTARNKNIDRLIEAVSGIECRLRIIGPLNEVQKARLSEFKIDWSNDVELGDAQIESAYEDADIVTLCSTDEGFGLPIIEGQAKAKIVITSDRSPMKDVAGNGARLVDPDSPESIREGILEVVADRELRERLLQEGRKNIERFDPNNIAAQYMALYRRVLGSSDRI